MIKCCFTSVCTDDSYQFFIPLFAYTVKRAYPNAGVKVFVKGKLKEVTKKALGEIKYGDCYVKENCFSKYPDKASITNSLRFLIGSGEFKGYDVVFVRDIDFLIFKGKISHAVYFKRRMKKLPYFGVRGPYQRPRRPQVNGIGWKRNFLRVAGGIFVFKNPEWFNIAGKKLSYYRKLLIKNEMEKQDRKPLASYRESDEVMLGRIIKDSGLPVPKRKGKDVYGVGMPKKYRDIHLGDFGKNRHGYKRLCRRASLICVRKFVELEKDRTWVKIRISMSEANPKIRELLRRLRKHAKRRLNSSCLSEGEIVRGQ